MIFNIKSTVGRRGIITEDSFSFTGGYLFARDDDTGNFEIALLESGTLTWIVNPGNVDLFLVGAGQNGDAGTIASGIRYGGKGGDGGRVYTETVSLSGACAAVVGTSGAESTLTNGGTTHTSANGAAPKEGGQGAIVANNYNSMPQANKAGLDGVFAYNAVEDETLISALSGVLFGPSGGGGHVRNANYYYSGQASVGGKNAGGKTGAGSGGTDSAVNGMDATGYGAGGGGGASDNYTGSGTGGAGADGIILIRNHREAV